MIDGHDKKRHDSRIIQFRVLLRYMKSSSPSLDTVFLSCLFVNNCFSSGRHLAYERMGRSLVIG